MGDDFHAFFRRSETGRQEFWFSLLLDNAETASAEGNEPSIMAESGNSNPDGLGSLENGRPLFDAYFNSIDFQFNGLIRHNLLK